MKTNKRRKRIVAELKRSAPLVANQSRDETLQQVLQEWLYQDEKFVFEALQYKLRLPCGARIFDDLIDLTVNDHEKRFVSKVQDTVHKLAVQFIVK